MKNQSVNELNSLKSENISLRYELDYYKKKCNHLADIVNNLDSDLKALRNKFTQQNAVIRKSLSKIMTKNKLFLCNTQSLFNLNSFSLPSD